MKGILNKKARGFTIVELLIVIVVIGILAAIVIVAYNGVQQRGRNTGRIQAASQYVKMLKVYHTSNNSTYPFSSGRYCLGTGFPEVSSANGTSGDCYNAQAGNSWLTSVNTTVNDELKKVGSLPESDKSLIVGTDGIPRVGPVAIWKPDGYLWVYYILERIGTEVCPVGSTEWSTTNTLICQIKVSD